MKDDLFEGSIKHKAPTLPFPAHPSRPYAWNPNIQKSEANAM
jgi:hypothetical protein